MAKHNTGRPQCKLCGCNHWNHEPHIWDDKPDVVKKLVVDIPELVVATAIKVVDKPTGSRHGKYADLEKRKKYQREYKRKLRAKK